MPMMTSAVINDLNVLGWKLIDKERFQAICTGRLRVRGWHIGHGLSQVSVALPRPRGQRT